MVDERIVAAARRLVDFPASGRVGRIAGTRELVINGTPYVAAYAVTQSAVRILRVLHGAREWPDMIPTSCASNFISGVNGAPIRFSPRSMGDTAVEEGQSSKIWTGNQSTDDIWVPNSLFARVILPSN